MVTGGGRSGALGLAGLRRASALTDLLFLFDLATSESTRLRPIADRLGVTVQAASHTYRELNRRGLAERRAGQYVPSMEGVAWLHRTLQSLSDDVFSRQHRLPIVRSCRAIAGATIRAGEPVTLELIGGALTALPGRGSGSRGRARSGGPRGALLEIEELEGILKIEPAEVRVLTIRWPGSDGSAVVRAIARDLSTHPPGLLGASGLEAYELTRRAVDRPIVRFAVGASAAEAARVGVPSTVVVLEEELSRLLDELPGRDRPKVSVRPIALTSQRRRSGPERSRQRVG
jgi:predicted transcriptional regulator